MRALKLQIVFGNVIDLFTSSATGNYKDGILYFVNEYTENLKP